MVLQHFELQYIPWYKMSQYIADIFRARMGFERSREYWIDVRGDTHKSWKLIVHFYHEIDYVTAKMTLEI